MGNKLRLKTKLQGYTPQPVSGGGTTDPYCPPTSGGTTTMGASCPTSADRQLLAVVTTTYATTTTTTTSVSPSVNGWTATTTNYVSSSSSVTVSQVPVPTINSANVADNKTTLNWTSTDSKLKYNVYRSTDPHPVGKAYLVGTGVTGTSFMDGTNLLHNSSFENVSSSGSIDAWTPSSTTPTFWSTDSTDSVAGNRSLKIESATSGTWGITLNVGNPQTWASGTTFTLTARAKTQNVVAASPNQNLKVLITYSDGSSTFGSATVSSSTWQTLKASVTALLQLTGKGTIWFDTVELDTQGAPAWNAGDLHSSKTYFYHMTAVDSAGVESAPSNEVSTRTPAATRLGLQSFWPYRGVDLAGGSGYVNMANGNLVYSATDLVYPGRLLATVFRRTYNSQGAASRSSLGYGWDSNWNWTLSSGTGGDMVLKEGDGSSFTFKAGGAGYLTPSGLRMRLVKNDDGTYTLASYDNNLRYDFDASGVMTRIREPNGNALTLVYEGGRLTRIRNSVGKEVVLGYAGDGSLTYVAHPGDATAAPFRATFQYDNLGNLVQASDLEGHSVKYDYDEHHQLVSVTDQLGNVTKLDYTGPAGAVAKVTYPDSASTQWSFNNPQNTFTDERGFATTYQVNPNGLLTRLTYHYGAETPGATGDKTASQTYEYDESSWLMTKYTNELGNAWTIAYDGYGNVVTTTDPDGKTTTSLWTAQPDPKSPGHVLNLLAQTTDPLGGMTTFTYDTAGNLVLTQDPLLETTAFTYDPNGLRLSAKDANGNETRYAYDPATGWLTQQTDALGGTVTYTYDVAGNPYTVTDPLHNLTRYIYDKLGRQKQITLPDGSMQLFAYDAAGNLTQSTDEAGAVTKYAYDTRNRVTTLTQWPTLSPAASDTGYQTQYQYNLAGLPKSVTDAKGKVLSTGYDGAGRKLWTKEGTLPTTVFTYDAAGNMTSIKDPKGNTATATYDKLNRQTKMTVPQSSTPTNMSTSYTYDALGRKATQKDELGNTTTYYYDAVSRLTGVVDPLGFETQYLYDRVGNRTAVVDAQRRTTQYVYDQLNRLIEEKGPDGVSQRSEYDVAGRKIAATNGRGQRTGYRYDERNRLVEISYPAARFVRYEYDAVGRRTAMTDWNGTTRYQYNALGWVQQVNDPFGNQLNYSYDQVGNRTELDLKHSGGTMVWKYGYDELERLKTLQSPGVATANTLTYDDDSRLTAMTYANADTVSLSYDQAGELTKILNTSKAYSTDKLIDYTTPMTRPGAARRSPGRAPARPAHRSTTSTMPAAA